MRQYNKIKEQYPGTILLFRVGDFYETFSEDAILVSKELGITLTKRNNGGDQTNCGRNYYGINTTNQLDIAPMIKDICSEDSDGMFCFIISLFTFSIPFS